MLKMIRKLCFFLSIVFVASSCQYERQSEYKKCMASGVETLYSYEFAPTFCKCFAKGISEGEAPFLIANNCSKPIIEKILNKEKE